CRSHGTFPLRLQSSHLNICYYHQDLATDGRPPLTPLGFAMTAALLLIWPSTCPDG
uniref:Uncharacterized protein n=1 Tax=Cannabis sativa TaxID=3483 RepID=A0A803QSQ5_CANSA